MAIVSDTTAAWRALRLRGTSAAQVAEWMALPEDEVTAYLGEEYIADAGDEAGPDQGMPAWFARDLARHLEIHRACLEDPDWNAGGVLPVNAYGDTRDDIDGLFGHVQVSIRGGRPGTGETALTLPLRTEAAEQWMMPVPGQPIAFLSSGLSAAIVLPEGIDYFALSESGADTGETADQRDPASGHPPEMCLGAFELFALAGDGDVLDPSLRTSHPDQMTPDYVDAVQAFLATYGVEEFRDAIGTIEVYLRDGAIRRLAVDVDYNPVLAGLFRFCADGRTPPFLLSPGYGKLKGVPMDRVAAVRFPWPLISLYGAHLGIDLEDGDEDDDDGGEEDDGDGGILVVSADMLPRGRA